MPRNPGGATGYNRHRRLTACQPGEVPLPAVEAAEVVPVVEVPATELSGSPLVASPKKPAKSARQAQPPR